VLPGLALKRDRSSLLVRPKLVRQLGMVLRRDKYLTKGLREVMRCLREFEG
jgi:hypothetical protein